MNVEAEVLQVNEEGEFDLELNEDELLCMGDENMKESGEGMHYNFFL